MGTQTQSPEPLEMPLGQGELILVVDDEASIREVLKVSLEIYNYRVITASDGIEAISLYAKHNDQIEAVLIDMMMPLLDGQKAIRALQNMNPQVKIIAMSGLASNEKIAQASGIKAFLSKPYTNQELLNTLHRVIG